MNRLLKFSLPVVATLLCLSEKAAACAVCTGSADAPIAPAMNASMSVLLVAITLLGGAFFRFLVFLARRDGLPLNTNQEISGGMTSPLSQQS